MIKQRILSKRAGGVSLLRLSLLNMGLLDELLAGFFVIGLPLSRQQLGLSYGQIGLIFSVAALAGMVFDPVINLLSDRGSKRWWILGGLCGLVIADILAGSIATFPVLLVAWALGYTSGGAAIGLSQAALIDGAPGESTRTMTRWTMVSGVGDLLSPLAVTTILAAGLGWTGLCLISAGLWLAVALVILPQRFPRPGASYSHENEEHDGGTGKSDVENLYDTEAHVSILQGLRQGLRDRILLRWATLEVLT
ncbi:MAG TPA: MFS transporter, partial [Ktedonobacteraceae bacterium]|nr:MFS transporter [Ktedonobacteraceae bacterium]